MGWFEEEQMGYNILWTPSSVAMDTALDLLLEAWINRFNKINIVVIPFLMELLWRIHMGKDADILFTIHVGMPFWTSEEHEHLIVALFLPIVSRR